jgi:hypothetical protein
MKWIGAVLLVINLRIFELFVALWRLVYLPPFSLLLLTFLYQKNNLKTRKTRRLEMSN